MTDKELKVFYEVCESNMPGWDGVEYVTEECDTGIWYNAPLDQSPAKDGSPNS